MSKKLKDQITESLTSAEEILAKSNWKVLVVDDDQDVHDLSRLIFRDFSFEGKTFELVSAFSAAEAEKMLKENPDVVLILLDVVMETEDAGLRFVKTIREDMNNNLVRIIIRTGQPGFAPETEVINTYDINDYREKTELTAQKIHTSIISALRSYRDLQLINQNREALKIQAKAFERFVPRDFLKHLNKEHITDIKLGDYVAKDMTVMFIDIYGFTALSEAMTSEENFFFLNSWLKVIEPVIGKHGGFIDKYLGDGVLALFSGDADTTIDGAVDMFFAMDAFNEERAKAKEAPISMGMGINAGHLIMGTVGGLERMDCTVISDSVNLASRLEDLTYFFKSNLLISKSFFDGIKKPDKHHIRMIGKVTPKGKTESTTLYEVYDFNEKEVVANKDKSKDDLQKGIELYQQADFAKSKTYFDAALETYPEDKIAKLYISETEYHERHGVRGDWTGVIETYNK